MKNKLIYPGFAFCIPVLRSVLLIAGGLLLLTLPPFRGMNLSDISMWWPLVCIAVNILTIVILFGLIKSKGLRFRDLYNHKKDKKKSVKEVLLVTPIMILLGIGGLMGFSWLVYGYMPVTTTQPLPLWAAIAVVILLPATIIFSEIPFYLGYCTPQLKSVTNNEFLSIAYPLFFYALQHSFMPLIFDFHHMLSRFLMFIPLLIMIGLWYNKKRDLVPLMAGHGLLDIFTGIQLLMVSLYPSIFELMRSGI